MSPEKLIFFKLQSDYEEELYRKMEIKAVVIMLHKCSSPKERVRSGQNRYCIKYQIVASIKYRSGHEVSGYLCYKSITKNRQTFTCIHTIIDT